MRFLLALTFVLAGCVTIYPPSYSSSARPTLPHADRMPATARADENVHIVQLFCPDGNFYFKAETTVSDYPGNPNCIQMAVEDMNSPISISLKYFTKQPGGNFADVILEKALGRGESSYREMPMNETRDYLVRGGQCGDQPFFLVVSAAKGFQNLTATQNYCRFEAEFRISSNLALAGVYPRVFGESIQSFVIKLTAK